MMNLLESIKNLFGFTPHATDSLPRPGAEAITPKPVASGLPPAAQQRDRMLRFMVDKLLPYQNEPGSVPNRIRLCVAFDGPENEELYRVALWDGQPGKFQAELNRQLADNYIRLPKNWQFDYILSPDALPACTYQTGNLGLIIQDKFTSIEPPRPARLTTLMGQTEQAEYVLDPVQQTSFCIGRGHTTQTTSGRVRTNDIVFLNDDDPGFDADRGASNGAVSRAHATIRYDALQQRYALLVDPGGLPGSGNKTKILHADDRMERADISGMHYLLQSGDQIELGGAVTLLFEVN